MCVALPGIVKKVNKDRTATVDFNGNLVNASTGIMDVHVNDHVLVHAGCILQVVNKKESDDLQSLFNEINDFFK